MFGTSSFVAGLEIEMVNRVVRLLRATPTVLFLLCFVAGTAVAGPFEDALAAHKRGDFATALRLFRPLANQGNANAQFNLGLIFEQGQGVPQDYVEAAKWYRLAADQGDAYAQTNLGFLYEKGQGVPQNYAEAAKLYRLAAEQGDAVAQRNLGAMYHFGWGVPKDYDEAVKWNCLAVDQGDAVAQRNLGEMYEKGEGVVQNYVEAAKLYRLAADQGLADAQINLGFMYAKGQGVPKDYAEAANWWRRAADQGEASAQFNLGLMYAKGEGVPKDYVRAHMWLNLSAAQGEQDAVKNRDIVARLMSPKQITEAQKLAREWKAKSGSGSEPQAVADCMKVGEVETAQGELAERMFHSAGGKPLLAFVLTLSAQICMRGDELENVDGVRTIELRTSDPALNQKMRRLVGKTVFVRGTASAGLTAWFYSPIVIDISEIQLR